MRRPSMVTWSLAVVLFGMLIAATNGFRIESLTGRLRKRTDDKVDTAIPIQKRYTEYQDNAIAYCTGSCMYKARLLYGDCYDLCNWNGRVPSPWIQFSQGRPNVKTDQSFAAPSNNWSSVLANRSGGHRQKSFPLKASTGERTAGPPVDGKKPPQASALRAIMGRKKGHKKDCT